MQKKPTEIDYLKSIHQKISEINVGITLLYEIMVEFKKKVEEKEQQIKIKHD